MDVIYFAYYLVKMVNFGDIRGEKTQKNFGVHTEILVRSILSVAKQFLQPLRCSGAYGRTIIAVLL